MSSPITDRNGGSSSSSPTTVRNTGLASSAAIKPPVVTLATTPLTLEGLQTVATVVLVGGDRVGVFGQTDASENGIYIAAAGGWARAPDFNRNDDVVDGTQFLALGGTNVGLWNVRCTTSPAVIGTTELSVQSFIVATGYVSTTAFNTAVADLQADIDAVDAASVKKTGDTMTGQLELPIGSGSSAAAIKFTRGGTETGDSLIYSVGNGLVQHKVNGKSIFRLDGSSATPAIGVGGVLDLSFTGMAYGQIKFPQTQNPSSDAHTLDDYEEGTWTPFYTATGATFGYNGQDGTYTKIGNFVSIGCRVGLQATGTSLAAAEVTLNGLPFPLAATPSAVSWPILWQSSTTAYINVMSFVSGGGTVMTFKAITAANTNPVGTTINASTLLSTSSILRFSGNYST